MTEKVRGANLAHHTAHLNADDFANMTDSNVVSSPRNLISDRIKIFGDKVINVCIRDKELNDGLHGNINYSDYRKENNHGQ